MKILKFICRQWYNIGLAVAAVAAISVGIYYIYYISVNDLASGADWAIGVVYTIAATVIILGYLTYIGLSNRNTKWVFDEAELKRFDIEGKLERKNIAVSGHEKRGLLAIIEKLKNGKQ